MKVNKHKPKEIIDELSEGLSFMLNTRKEEFLRRTNFWITDLFWDIGTRFNETDQSAQALDAQTSASKLLTEFYPWHFNSLDLSAMRSFASLQDKNFCNKIASYIGWPYIVTLLKIESEDEWIHYIRLAIDKKLSLSEFKKVVAAHKPADQALSKPKFSDYPFFDLLSKKNNLHKPLPLVNYFKGKYAMPFKQLLDQEELNNHFFIHKRAIDELAIIQQSLFFIKQFQQNLNAWLNFRFNQLFWELGNYIVEKSRIHPDIENRIAFFIHELSRRLTATFGGIFTPEMLSSAVNFALKVSDPIEAAEIAMRMAPGNLLLLSESDLSQIFTNRKLVEDDDVSNELLSIINSNHHSVTSSGFIDELPKNSTNIFENQFFLNFINGE